MAKQQQPGQGGDNSLDFLWLVVLIVAALYAIWHFGKDIIAAGLFTVRYYEILILHHLNSFWSMLTGWAGVPKMDLTSLNYWLEIVERHMGRPDLGMMREISLDVGLFYRYGLAIILFCFGAAAYMGSALTRFNEVQSMESLMAGEQELWAAITPVMDQDLVSQKLDEGPWRLVEPPMKFVKKNNLAEEVVKERKTVLELDRGRARSVFMMQLGELWVSAHHLPAHMQALFVIFGARAEGKREMADNLLEQISRSSRSGRLDFSGAKLALIKLRNSDLIAKVVYRHAYIYTVMAAMLELARSDGVLAASEFLWLKPLDRNLWYVLNDVGRQTPSTESAGVFAHLRAEQKFGRPLRVPMVEEAVNGLEEALGEILYEPDDK